MPLHETAPDFEGPAGEAWAVTAADLTVDSPAVVGAWLLATPRAHPLWRHYLLTMVHLRPVDGLPAATLTREDATHELVVQALDPDHDAKLDPADTATLHPLAPPDVSEQLVLDEDDQARDVGVRAVRACVGGTLSPDSDFRSLWRIYLHRWEAAARDAA